MGISILVPFSDLWHCVLLGFAVQAGWAGCELFYNFVPSTKWYTFTYECILQGHFRNVCKTAWNVCILYENLRKAYFIYLTNAHSTWIAEDTVGNTALIECVVKSLMGKKNII